MRQEYNFLSSFFETISPQCAKRELEFNNHKMPPKKRVPAAATAQEEDVSMADASPAPAASPELDYDIEIDDQRIRIVSSTTCRCHYPILTPSFSFQELQTLQLHSNSRRRITHWGMHCGI